VPKKKKKTVLDENKDLGFLELETQGENMKSK
jgi:hypothetical protein